MPQSYLHNNFEVVLYASTTNNPITCIALNALLKSIHIKPLLPLRMLPGKFRCINLTLEKMLSYSMCEFSLAFPFSATHVLYSATVLFCLLYLSPSIQLAKFCTLLGILISFKSSNYIRISRVNVSKVQYYI